MAKSRQQLIQGSSFLKNEKEKIGGLNVKRSTITADSFKKGTSQESSDNIEGRVTANEKKITLLKNIVKLRKQNVDKQLKPEAEQDKSQQMGSPLLESLQSIASTVDSIRDTLIQQQDNDKGVAESMRREKEEDERQGQEKGLESSKPNIIQKAGDAIMKPVMSLWDRIFNFLKTLFLGKILMNFLDWFGNPANQGKILTLVRFVKDWWPALVGAVLLFGTGFGGLVAGLIKTIMWFIPAMGKAIAFMRSAKFLSMIPGGGKIGKVLTAGALVGGGMLLGNAMSGGGDDQQEPLQMNKGGQVPGSGPNKDTVPAMLTPGEFVMSRGAVEQYGVDTLEGMNAAAGGTNIPVLMPDKKRKGFRDGGDPTAPTAEDFGLSKDFNYDNPEDREEFVKVISPHLKNFMEQQNKAVDENPDAYNGVKLTLDRDGKMPNFGEFIANQSEVVYNQSLAMVQSNESIPEEVRGILSNRMMELRQEVTNNPNWKGDIAFDINKDIPGTAAYRILMAEEKKKKQSRIPQWYDLEDESYSQSFSATEIAALKNKNELSKSGKNFNKGGLVQYLNNGGKVSEMPPKKGFEGWETYDTSGMKGVVTREPTDYKSGIKKFTLPDGSVQYETIPSLFEQAKSRKQNRSTNRSTNKQGGGFKRMVGGAADFVTGGMWDFDKRNRKGAPKDSGIRRIAGGLTDWATMGLTDFDKRGKGNLQVDPIGGGKDKAWGAADEQAKRGEEQSGMGIKRGIGGALDFMTLGAFDFDKQNPEGSPKGFGPARMLGGIADHMTMGLTDFDKRGAGNLQFNPIGGGDNKKWDIGPKKPKNTVVAYEQEAQKENQQESVPEGGNEIPKITIKPPFIIEASKAKISVLGII